MKLVTYLHDGKKAVGVLTTDGAAARPLPFADMNALIDVFDNLPPADSDVPTLIVCNTEKGHGVSFMANNPDWHMGNITDETMNKALAELQAAYKEKWGED